MQRRMLTLLVTATLLVGCSPDAITLARFQNPLSTRPLNVQAAKHEPTFDYTTIDSPSWRGSIAYGINAAGDVVGEFTDAAGRVHGYRLREGELTQIDYPGAALTQARGIGPGGDVVGTYRLPGEVAPAFHGFRLTRQGEFLTVGYRGHASVIPQRILPDGTILGCRHDHDLMTTMRGVFISGEHQGEIDAFASMHNGATPDMRRIAGLFTDMMTGRGEGYVIDDGEFKPFVIPGSSFTAAWDVNPKGDIAGIYLNSRGFHGFVLSDDGYVTLDVPGATATRSFGLNARGDVVGSYAAGGKTRSYVARRAR